MNEAALRKFIIGLQTAALTLLLVLQNAAAFSQERYIDDTIFVPLRSGQGNNYRIIHKGLKSGTKVALIEDNPDSNWSLVRTTGGLEGWLPTHYLSDAIGAQQQLESALLRIDMMNSENKPLVDRIDALTMERDSLASELGELRIRSVTLETELTEVRQISASALQLDRSNKQLSEQAEILKNRIELLEADNQRLRNDEWQKWFINGVYATGVGGLLTLILPRLLQRRKRHSEWA